MRKEGRSRIWITDGPNRGPVSVTLFGWVACDGYLVQVLQLLGGWIGWQGWGCGRIVEDLCDGRHKTDFVSSDNMIDRLFYLVVFGWCLVISLVDIQ